MNGLRLYFRYIGISIQSQLQYRASVLMTTLGNLAITFIDFLGLWVLFERFGSLKDWSLEEAALFYGMVHTAFAISESFSRGFDIFHRQVRNGEFDRSLLRPRSTVLQVLGYEFQLMRIGRFTQGLIVLIWGASRLNTDWTLGKMILLICAILGGSLLFSGLFVLQATLSFWSVQSLEIVNTMTYGGVETAQFPLSIYTPWFRRFFIFIIPLATINYFPAMAILGKTDVMGYSSWVYWASPLAGLVFFLLSLRIWKFGMRFYMSTGS